MRQIIDGKTYNTDTAESIGGYTTNNGNYGQYLYRTKKGAYFIETRGKPEGVWRYDHYLILVTKEEAIDFLQTNQDFDALEKYFPESIVEG